MCGISVVIHYRKQHNCQCLLNYESAEERRLYLIRNRGPNSYAKQEFSFPVVDVQFHASVLHLRGPAIVVQPLVHADSGNVLLWNGEIFGGVSGSDEENDTSRLLSLLDKCNSEQEVINVFSSIQGPWAFVFFFKNKMQLFFGRDIIGRRSLLWKEVTSSDSSCQLIILSSVANSGTNWNSVPANGIFSLNLTEQNNILFYPWTQNVSGNTTQTPTFPFCVSKSSDITSPITKALDKSDPENDSNYLEFEEVIKGIAGKNSEMMFQIISKHNFFQKNVESFLNVLGESVKLRVNSQSLWCAKCCQPVCGHKNIAVLFSGGLDCSVLAVLADRFLPPDIPIDLINVSFEHSVVLPQKKSKKQLYQHTFDSPDRLSALKSYGELKELFPDRKWNFVAVNVGKLELQDCRESRVQALILPHQTVLDDSIGCALWFASRGQGMLKNDKEELTNYTSPARIALLGMGADEQLGGYSRHRNKFQKDGWSGLNNEIQLEIDRISERNLARDDRIISDSGREARFPYLDENVVSFLNSVPIWLKANLKLPRGIGEKLILRVAAYSLGLRFATVLPKRAIQFGSRIAHLETKSEKGSDVCTRLQSVEL